MRAMAPGVKMYGCDGQNRAFEFDGTTFVPIAISRCNWCPSNANGQPQYFKVIQVVNATSDRIASTGTTTTNLGEKVLGDRQRVLVRAVTHHEQPARQPLLETVRTVARHRYHDLFQKGVYVSGHEISEGRHRLVVAYVVRPMHC